MYRTSVALLAAAMVALGEARTIVKQGSHESNTRDENGNFKHPFLHESPDVTTIIYPDSKTFSMKIQDTRTSHPADVAETDSLELELQGLSHRNWTESAWGFFSRFLAGTTYTVGAMENLYDLQYFGTIYIGTPHQEVTRVFFDTSLGFSAFETSACDTTCAFKAYNTGNSSSYALVNSSNQI